MVVFASNVTNSYVQEKNEISKTKPMAEFKRHSDTRQLQFSVY